MPQVLLDEVFKKTKPPSDSAGPSALRGAKVHKGKVVNKRQGSSQGHRCSLEGYVVQSSNQYDVQPEPGRGEAVHIPAESWSALGSLRNGAFVHRPCSGQVLVRLDNVPAPDGVEQAPEESQSALSNARRSAQGRSLCEEAMSTDALKPPSSHLSCFASERVELVDGCHDIPTTHNRSNKQEDGLVKSQFCLLPWSNKSAPEVTESSLPDGELGGPSSKRDPSPTTLHSGDAADRKKPRVSYKDLWVAASILDNVVEEDYHRSPEKKPRLSMSPKCVHKQLKPRTLAEDIGQRTDNSGGAAIAYHCDYSVANPCKDVKQKCEGVEDLSKLQIQQVHGVLPSLPGTSEVDVAKLVPVSTASDVLRTPLASINGRPDFSVKTKSRPWSYNVSMFSPGDEFWNEAIQVVDDLLAPTEGGNHGISLDHHHVERSGNRMLSPARSTATGSIAEGTELKQSDAAGRGEGKTYFGEVKARCAGFKLNPLDPMNPCNEAPQVTLDVQSPLPVRHFNFNSQGSPVEERKAPLDSSHRMYITLESRAQSDQNEAQINGAMCRLSTSEITERESVPRDVQDAKLQNEALLKPRFVEACSLPEQTDRCLDAEIISNKQHHSSRRALGDVSDEVRSDVVSSESRTHVSEVSEPPDESKVQEQTPPVLTKPGSASLSSKPALDLTDWLPATVAAVYKRKGVTQLYPWQVECLMLNGVLEGKNVVFSASTSAGKSLVAEILMIRRIISTDKKAILVLPYVALCSEKAEHLEALLEPMGKRVRSFFGTQGSKGFPNDTSIAVCTIEKANVLINKLLEEERLGEIAVIIIDELHMVGDADRGYLLELMLTKLRYAAGEGPEHEVIGGQSGHPGCSPGRSQGAGLQIVGMSATIANLPAVACWLKAAMYETRFRPVPLEEFIKVGPLVYNKRLEVVRTMRKGADIGGKDQDHVVEMCEEVVRDGHSVLIFCSSRKACEQAARHVAKFLSSFEKPVDSAVDVQAVLEGLKKSPAGLCEVLAETLPRGVAYHHAGLTSEEREAVESCFKLGIIKVLTATSTLAAGVNLPARRVILRQPRVGLEYLDATRYRQMTGRAGRAGLDTKGESVIICKPDELKRMSAVMDQGCLPLCSCLAEDRNGMVRALLEVVASGIVQTANDIHCYVKCTLLSSTQPFEEVVSSAKDALKWLCHQRLIAWDETLQVYNTTPLGRAAFGSSLTPEESLVVFEDLAKAREGFVLASDLHLVYQVTPIYIELEPDWGLFHRRFIELSQIEQAVGNRVGVTEPFLMRMAHGGAAGVHMRTKTSGNGNSPKSRNSTRSHVARQAPRGSPLGGQMPLDQTLRVCRRFYVALMLSRLVQEVPLHEICGAYKVPRGTVQGLQERAGRFAGMVTAFCERLGWHDLEGLVSKFQNRVSFGVRSEIVELTEIPFVKAARARALYKAGYRTVQAVAEATIFELAKVLYDSSTWADTARQHVQQAIQCGMAKKIKLGARRIVLDKAEEARIAAFSACRALGVDVPSLGVPLPDVAGISDSSPIDTKYELSTGKPFQASVSEEKQAPSEKLPKQGVSDMLLQSGVQNSDEELYEAANSGAKSLAEGKPTKEESKLAIGSRAVTTRQVHNEASVDMPKKSGFDQVAVFGGFERDTCRQVSEPEHVDRGFNVGPVDVDKMAGGFEKFLSMWQTVKEFAFDLHFTKSKDKLTGLYVVEGVAVCWQSSPVFYVSLLKRLMSGKLPQGNQTIEGEVLEDRWSKIRRILGDDHSRKLSWDVKLQMQALEDAGFQSPSPDAEPNVSLDRKVAKLLRLPSIVLGEPFIDVRVAAWLLWPDEMSSHNVTLEHVVKTRLPGEVAAAVGRASRWSNQMGRAAHNGCCRRAAQIRELHTAFLKLLVSEGLHEPLLHLEMPLVPVLVRMESCGIHIDMNDCRQMRELLVKKIEALDTTAHALAGINFSLSAPAEVADILYKHLKLPVPPGCNKGKLHPSTDKQALDYLRNQHPISDIIKEHRTVHKLLHGTVGSIISFAQHPVMWKEGQQSNMYKLSGRWLHTSTATGRLAVEEPNLQCVEHAVCFDLNGEDFSCASKFLNSGKLQINVRDMFVPSQENWVFIAADYSQIELRLMAHFSGDPSMTSLLSNPSGDFFRQLAAQWTGLTESNVTDKRREQTKRLVYGILYGMGVNALAEQMDCSAAEAADNTEKFKSAFPGITAWLQQTVESCRKLGYITTLGGRKRFLDKISTSNRGEQAKAERQAVNSICQGSAADLIKIAMTKVHSATSRKCDCTLDLANGSACHTEGCSSLFGRCRLLLQIHDELILEVDSKFVKEAAELVQSCMRGAASLNVPLLVKTQIGRSWGSMHAYNEAEYA